MKRCVLIDKRFEVINYPDGIEVFDLRHPCKDENGQDVPVKVIPSDAPKINRVAVTTALAAMRDDGSITASEYYIYAEAFLVQMSSGQALE